MTARFRYVVLALLLLPALLRAQAEIPATPPPPDPGVPVVLAGDTLFRVYTPLGPFTPLERAAAVRARLERIADAYGPVEPLRVVHGDGMSNVLVGEVVVTTVTEEDAAVAGVERQALALEDARAIAAALREHGFLSRLRTIGLGVLFALMATLATVVMFRFVQRLFPRMAAAVEAGRTTWMPALRIQKLELISADNVTDTVLWILRVVKTGTLALLLYITIPIILSFFPWTEQYADRLFGYVLAPFALVWRALIAYLPNLFIIGAIVVVTWYLLKLIRLFFVSIRRGTISFQGFHEDWAMPTYQIVRFLVFVFATIAVWPYLPGSGSEAFQGVGVFLGLLISLGSAAAISNIIGGVVLTYMRPFRVGDRVKIADTVGDVVEKNLLVTRVRTIKNVDITVPNSMILGSHIVNYSSSASAHGLILNPSVTIGYDVPWREVHELLLASARDCPGILPAPAPFVLQTALNDFYVAYELNAYTDQPNRMAALYSVLHQNIQDRFNEAGVEILSPHYRAQRDGNVVTIPAGYLPADYRAPGFRVESVDGTKPDP